MNILDYPDGPLIINYRDPYKREARMSKECQNHRQHSGDDSWSSITCLQNSFFTRFSILMNALITVHHLDDGFTTCGH